MSDSVQPYGQQPTRLLCPRDSLGKNAGVGCHFLLRSAFQAGAKSLTRFNYSYFTSICSDLTRRKLGLRGHRHCEIGWMWGRAHHGESVVPRSIPVSVLWVEVKKVSFPMGGRGPDGTAMGRGHLRPGQGPNWPALAPRPAPSLLSRRPHSQDGCSNPRLTPEARLPPTAHLPTASPSLPRRCQKKGDQTGAGPGHVPHRAPPPLRGRPERTASWTDRKLFSSSTLVHQARRQFSRWSLGTSQTGPQGTRENSATSKETENR